MSRDKQISEMAKAICHAPTCEIRKNGGTCYKYCKAYIYATRAIDKGYIKASEVAREIFEELEKLVIRRMIADSALIDDRLITDIAELKKKYTQDLK